MTGWHLPDVNPVLEKHLDELALPQKANGELGARILFPLCGKTVDMAFMARRGYRVVGVDGVKAAIDGFVAEHSATGSASPVVLPKGIDGERFRGYAIMPKVPEGEQVSVMPQPVILIECDFLSIGRPESHALVPFDAAFDRGSLVAVNPSDRPQYMAALAELIAPGGKVLLVAHEHDPFSDGSLGPPFEVTEPQLRELCAGKFDVKWLSTRDELDEVPVMRQAGVTYYRECVYMLQRLAPAA